MFARVVKMDIKPGKEDESTRIYEEVIRGAGAQEGFKGALLLEDPETGKGMSITLWESEEDMVRNEESGWWQAQVDKFSETFTNRPEREHFSVAFEKLPREDERAQAREELAVH